MYTCITVWLFFIRLVGQNEIQGTFHKYLPQFALSLCPKFSYYRWEKFENHTVKVQNMYFFLLMWRSPKIFAGGSNS